MPNTFDWIEIRTSDIEASAHFYESLFAWKMQRKVTADGLDLWLFDTGGEPRLENLRRGGIWLRAKGEPLGVVVYIVVDDIEVVLKKAIEFGGKVIGSKAPQGSAYRAYFADPDGNIFGLWEEKTID